MSHSPSVMSATAVACNVCHEQSNLLGQTAVLKKHPVRYFRCEHCGFIQTEKPYWLHEAYSTAIAGQDVGIMARNLFNRAVTTAVLNLHFPKATRLVDFGAGHGILVRMMRDLGFNFVWLDRYASNDYARGFEHKAGDKYEFLTAFEVLEHLENPVADLGELMDLSDNLFVSTELVPEPVPRPPDWWYYVPTSGQHVSFYTRKALQILAKRFGRTVLSRGSYHLFSREPQSESKYRLATNFNTARLINRLHRRQGLLESDFKLMTR